MEWHWNWSLVVLLHGFWQVRKHILKHLEPRLGWMCRPDELLATRHHPVRWKLYGWPLRWSYPLRLGGDVQLPRLRPPGLKARTCDLYKARRAFCTAFVAQVLWRDLSHHVPRGAGLVTESSAAQAAAWTSSQGLTTAADRPFRVLSKGCQSLTQNVLACMGVEHFSRWG